MGDLQNKPKNQLLEELEKWHEQLDPWGFETNPADQNRRDLLLSELPIRPFKRVLDIGCGQGFITRDLPGETVIGLDISSNVITHAQKYATERLSFVVGDFLQPPASIQGPFDLIVGTHIFYPQYVGSDLKRIYRIVNSLLAENGVLTCVHEETEYNARFPYFLSSQFYYRYKEVFHRLEIYIK